MIDWAFQKKVGKEAGYGRTEENVE